MIFLFFLRNENDRAVFHQFNSYFADIEENAEVMIGKETLATAEKRTGTFKLKYFIQICGFPY